MTEALKIIYEANQLDVWLWCDENKLKFKFPTNVNASEIKIKLSYFKGEILKILKNNEVFNDNFIHPFIYRMDDLHISALSFAQERLWFIEEYEQGTNAYHIPVVYELSPAAEQAGLSYAIRSVVERHEVLRSTIAQGEEDNRGLQEVHERPLELTEVIIEEGEDYEGRLRADINRPFELSVEYPIRVCYYILKGSGRRLLLINTHHIASDGWSSEIFQRELSAYYQAYINGDKGFSLPALPIQYKDYALWQRSYLTGEILSRQLSYWKEKLEGYQTLSMPTDYTRPQQIE